MWLGLFDNPYFFSFNGTIPTSDWPSVKSPSHIHDGIKMTEYENEPFVVGDYNHTEVEFLHMSHEKWFTASPYQTSVAKPRRIFGYSAVSRPGKVFIIGGCRSLITDDEPDDWSEISIFENDEWRIHRKLEYGRINFLTIQYGTDVMIIGGTLKNRQSLVS